MFILLFGTKNSTGCKQYQKVHKSESDEVKETRHSAARDHERDDDDDDTTVLFFNVYLYY
jgi:hypothetical protein